MDFLKHRYWASGPHQAGAWRIWDSEASVFCNDLGSFDQPQAAQDVADHLNGKEAKPAVPVQKRKTFIVWNAARTEGFVTTDYGLAYEVRKSAESNCFDEDGRQSHVAQAFCNAWGLDHCTLEEVEL